MKQNAKINKYRNQQTLTKPLKSLDLFSPQFLGEAKIYILNLF